MVLCETYLIKNIDSSEIARTHANTRNLLTQAFYTDDPQFGLEQEFFLFKEIDEYKNDIAKPDFEKCLRKGSYDRSDRYCKATYNPEVRSILE